MRRYHRTEIVCDCGCDGEPHEGAYYLLRRVPEQGSPRYVLRTEPGRKNMSNAICTDGWLGTTNNVAWYADGAVRVRASRITPIPVEQIERSEELAAE